MKAFILASVALVMTFAAVAVGGVMIERTASGIIEYSKEATDMLRDAGERRASLDKVKDTLDGGTLVLTLGVGHDEVALLRSYLSDAYNQIEGDEGQYLAALEKLITEAEKIRMTGSFTLDGII